MNNLIDRDKLCNDLLERWDIADKKKEELIRQVMADIVVPIVVSQPIVDSIRKNGKWITKEGKMCFHDICSECGHKYIHIIPCYNFCPNCGCQMMIGEEQ